MTKEKQEIHIDEIHIDWEGPFSYEEMQGMDGDQDYGIYQFYGCHPVYGADTLLYIGMAQNGTFASRMKNFKDHQVRWDKYSTSGEMTAYVGRLAGAEQTPDYGEWNREIEAAEKLLIYAHSPAWNSQELNLCIYEDGDTADLFNLHIFNWGKYKRLLPEVSGMRYARYYPRDEDFNIYTKSR